MQLLLAPSKTMTMTRSYPKGLIATRPYFAEDAARIVAAMRGVHIVKTMQVSQVIADTVEKQFLEWGKTSTPALFAYIGDVYRWFYAETLSEDDLLWAQNHLFIMSGLYGALRPFDMVSPYRMEMKAKITVDGAKDIYDFWGKRIAKYIDMEVDDLLCNLSSDEYARVVTKYTKKRVVTPVFMDNKADGSVGPVPIYSKMMRGVMARWIIDRRIENPKQLQDFSSQGYVYDAALSTENVPVFYRQVPKPIRFS